MAGTTANLQKMTQSAIEMENISIAMVTNHSKLKEVMEQLTVKWQGQAATSYIETYRKHSPDLEDMARIIDEAATNLRTIGTTYSKAESSATAAVRSMLAKG